MKILEAEPSDLPSFFEYLGVQLLDNASDDTPLFQPIAKKYCHITPELEMKFRDGFESRVGEPSWRKLWVAKDSNGDIRGHIDLRHHSGEYRSHRVLLGMGVDTSVRKRGVGGKLVEVVTQFCLGSEGIDWLDLNVLSNNLPAKNLYLKCGFMIIGEMADCYRIDGVSVPELTMALRTKGEG